MSSCSVSITLRRAAMIVFVLEGDSTAPRDSVAPTTVEISKSYLAWVLPAFIRVLNATVNQADNKALRRLAIPNPAALDNMMRDQGVALCLLVALFVGSYAQDSATLSVQFDNRQKTVLGSSKRQAVLNAIADSVCLVPRTAVSVVGGVDQSGLLSSQSVVTFKCVGPTKNRKTVLANCQENTKGFLLFDSPAKKAVKKATDTWWPGDSVKIQKATCAKA